MATMGGRPERHPIKMFDTDYENYEIYYDCKEYFGFKNQKSKVGKKSWKGFRPLPNQFGSEVGGGKCKTKAKSRKLKKAIRERCNN